MKALDRTAERRRRLEAGACFALLACCIQALLPFLIAFEIQTAAAETAHCHVATADSAVHREAGPAHHQEHGSCLAACPICLALSAAHAFTAPAAIALPSPPAVPLVRLASSAAQDFLQTAPAPYEARAPPALL